MIPTDGFLPDGSRAFISGPDLLGDLYLMVCGAAHVGEADFADALTTHDLALLSRTDALKVARDLLRRILSDEEWTAVSAILSLTVVSQLAKDDHAPSG